ncbi:MULTISPECIES: PLD nuclease N-terminal domain-containing protein [Geomicrobium]|uniref:Magnesium-transporting ATPase (P-type) n=1 Tax=Geomicrobium sediminis TaxID=1347788 RepID=A0ABS2P9S8_9BACL|nr:MULTISPECIES: PLD nuclease N-terminal domain-containing protein [Geomicrobium]MBM7632167.1 magnesium-transporting ATPase (P-type) [Geomicrobium sediminis]GAK08893.1 hypothetical protein JCM19038_2693 [Geomicrobium sp. JCM 19038]
MPDLFMLVLPLIIIEFILKIIAFIDLYRRESTSLPKWLWALIILFVNTIGPILYLVLGKQRRQIT